VLDGVTALLPREQEVRHLLDTQDAWEVARSLVDAGFPEVVLKLGARGAVLAQRERPPLALPAAPLAPVAPLDPTGAGDAFCGAYAASRLLGFSPVDAARRATVAAAMVVGSAGAEAGLTLDRGHSAA
jgi:ribokinase